MKNNEKEYRDKINDIYSKNEKRSKFFKSIFMQEDPKPIFTQPSQFEYMNKLHNYREFVRNKEAMDTSQYNKQHLQKR